MEIGVGVAVGISVGVAVGNGVGGGVGIGVGIIVGVGEGRGIIEKFGVTVVEVAMVKASGFADCVFPFTVQKSIW